MEFVSVGKIKFLTVQVDSWSPLLFQVNRRSWLPFLLRVRKAAELATLAVSSSLALCSHTAPPPPTPQELEAPRSNFGNTSLGLNRKRRAVGNSLVSICAFLDNLSIMQRRIKQTLSVGHTRHRCGCNTNPLRQIEI